MQSQVAANYVTKYDLEFLTLLPPPSKFGMTGMHQECEFYSHYMKIDWRLRKATAWFAPTRGYVGYFWVKMLYRAE